MSKKHGETGLQSFPSSAVLTVLTECIPATKVHVYLVQISVKVTGNKSLQRLVLERVMKKQNEVKIFVLRTIRNRRGDVHYNGKSAIGTICRNTQCLFPQKYSQYRFRLQKYVIIHNSSPCITNGQYTITYILKSTAVHKST